MDWHNQLITLYLYVCKHYEQTLCAYSQRMSNHADLSFTDDEVITLYLFGVMNKHTDIKQIHTYTDLHLRDWFLKIPGYTAFVQRLNRVADVFVPLWRWFKTNKKVQTPEYIEVTGQALMMAKSLTKSVLFYTATIFMVIKPICVQIRNKSWKTKT